MRDVATFIALNRFGLGAVPGEGEAIGGDPRGWVATQIDRRAAPRMSGGRASDGVLAEILRVRSRHIASNGMVQLQPRQSAPV